MNIRENCPYCRSKLIKKSLQCSCSWATANNRDDHSTDFQCSYWLAKVRCKEQGTICQISDAGKWYCAKHWYHADSLFNTF